MVPVVIQDFSRQRRALDDGDFSKYFWSFPVAEAACDKQSFVFLSMHFHHLLYSIAIVHVSIFNPPNVTLHRYCQRSIVRSDVWSDGPGDFCVNPFSFWKSKFHSLQTVLITPSHSSLIHPMRNYPQSMVSWLYSTVCTIAYILLCLAVVTNVLFFSPPPRPWYNEWIFLKLLVPVMLSSLSLVHPCPRESLVHIWHYKKWLAVSSSLLHTALDIDQWEG